MVLASLLSLWHSLEAALVPSRGRCRHRGLCRQHGRRILYRTCRGVAAYEGHGRGRQSLLYGIMGGLSTYSTLIMSTEKLLGDPDETVLAIVFLVLSMILGLILASFGMWLGQKIGKGRGKAFRRD